MNTQQLQRWLRWGLAAVMAGSYLLAAFAVARSGLVPAKYLVPLLGAATLLVVLLAVALIRQVSAGVRIVAAVAAVVVTAGSLYGFTASRATTDFLATIQEDPQTTIEYSILAKRDRNITLDNDTTGTTGTTLRAGILATDTNNQAVKAKASALMRAEYAEYGELTSLTLGIDDAAADVAVLKSSYLQLLQENYAPFYTSVEVLDTFVIQVAGDGDGDSDNNAASTSTDVSKPFAVYISGIDTYGSISTVSRSDVNMLLVVDPVANKVLLVNTPRDYYVQLHGTTGVRDKLTHAGIYGVAMSRQTLEDLYGIPIDFYVKVNFSSLTRIVDTLGGIDVYSDYAFRAGKDSYQVGYNSLDAPQALAFARARYAFEGGDRVRGQNQQRVIEAIIQKLSSPRTLVNYQAILASLQGSLQTDMPADTISALVREQLDTMDGWSTETMSVDGTDSRNVTYSLGSLPVYVMEPDLASVRAAQDKIRQYAP